jgi:hypothetical protein
MCIFMAVTMTPSVAVSDFGGRRYRRFVPSTFSYSWELLPTSMGSLVFDTQLCRQNTPLSSQRPTLQLAVETETLLAGVVVNGNNLLLMSLSPLSITPTIILFYQ